MKTRGLHSQRGAVLLVALLFGTLVAIALGSYVALNTQSLKMSHRSFYLSHAINMAESGLEEAIWSFNQAHAGDATAWTGWDISDGVSAKRTFTDFVLGPNVTGTVKVHIDRYNPTSTQQPKVLALAAVTLPDGQAAITKMVEARMRRRSYFAAGLVAKNGITFSGTTASVDSWISNPDNDASTPAVHYAAAVRRARGSIAASSVTATLAIGNADVYGTAAVGGSSTAAIQVGSNGRVGPFGTSNGVKDPASIATDFSTNMETVSAPTTGTVLASLGSTLGTAGTTTVWRAPKIENDLTIFGDVTLILTVGPGVDAIDITGSETITVSPGASLKIYVEGNVKIAGNGLLNTNAAPETFQLWGTGTSSSAQSIQISGNGALRGVVYAPNAGVQINGNGDVMGAVVARTIDVTGNAAFHYDESLAGWGSDTPFGVYQWREILTSTERTTNAALLAF